MSRTRLIRPSFFGDEDIAGLSRDSRLAYVGIWTECDDAGYFENRPRQLARALFGYDPDGVAVIETAIAALAGLQKIELLECGTHAVVPSLPIHGQQGGNKAFTFRSAHERGCLSGQVRTPPEPVRTGVEQGPESEPVRTRPNKSSSESVSDSESGQRREKKNVKEEGVDGINEARTMPAAAAHLSDPPSTGRPNASPAPSTRPVLTVPPGLAAATPQWRHPCTDYVHHQSAHLIIDGQAVCPPCEEKLAAAGATRTNGVEAGAQGGLGLA